MLHCDAHRLQSGPYAAKVRPLGYTPVQFVDQLTLKPEERQLILGGTGGPDAQAYGDLIGT